ncbi:TPA: NAD-dependent epimerase/dehydratase family protein, partial [Streptococcus agalactiae]
MLNLQNEGEGTMEILIAGGSGFLGKQIIKAALTKGHKVAYLSRHEG